MYNLKHLNLNLERKKLISNQLNKLEKERQYIQKKKIEESDAKSRNS